jgi:hypothetical protein
MSMSLAQMIANQARRTGADPLTLLATAIVESNLNPNAVGDGGTSYGLFQMHVGGAGGRTHGEARRYLDPRTAVENRARHFRGGSGGAFAASVQRPADPSGYARKVDAVIAQLRAGKSPYSKALSGAGMPAGSLTGPSTGPSAGGNKAAAIGLIFGDDPVFNMAAQSAVAVKPSAGVASPIQAEGKGFFARRKGETGQQYLDRLLQKKFGLRHDPGNSQTTGGRHSAGSGHYRGTATDFGDARNDPRVLQAAENWLEQNASNIVGGLKLSWYGRDDDASGGHDDHAHFETYRSLRPSRGLNKRRFA